MVLSLEGKTFVVMGVANKRSIGWGIADGIPLNHEQEF